MIQIAVVGLVSLLYTSDMAGAPAESSRSSERVVRPAYDRARALLGAETATAAATATATTAATDPGQRRGGGATRRRRDAATGITAGW